MTAPRLTTPNNTTPPDKPQSFSFVGSPRNALLKAQHLSGVSAHISACREQSREQKEAAKPWQPPSLISLPFPIPGGRWQLGRGVKSAHNQRGVVSWSAPSFSTGTNHPLSAKARHNPAAKRLKCGWGGVVKENVKKNNSTYAPSQINRVVYCIFSCLLSV